MKRHHRARSRIFREQGPLLILVGVMFLLFFAQVVFGEDWYEGLMAVPGELERSWARVRAGDGSIGDGQVVATLLSHAFLHGNFQHVAFNMLYFWIFGALIAELLGWRWMLGVFALTAIAGGLMHTLMNRGEFVPMLGASGAVMGFEGAYLGLATRWRLPDPHVWPMARPIPPSQLALLAVIGVGVDYFSIMRGQDTGVAYGAHLGGFAMGIVMTVLLTPRPAAAM